MKKSRLSMSLLALALGSSSVALAQSSPSTPASQKSAQGADTRSDAAKANEMRDQQQQDRTRNDDNWEKTHRASKIIGTEVRNPQGEKIGDIRDLVMQDPTSGEVTHAVIGVGGVLGMGDKLFAVRYDALKPAAGKGHFVLEQGIDLAKAFDEDKYADQPAWSSGGTAAATSPPSTGTAGSDSSASRTTAGGGTASGTNGSTVAPATNAAPAATAAANEQQQASKGMEHGALKDKLDKMGVKDLEQFKGHLVSAQSPDGQPVLFVIGPKNMQGDKSVDGLDLDRIRDDLGKAGFRNISFVSNAQMERGRLEDKDQQVLALSATSAGWQPASGSAQNSTPDVDRLKQQLDDAGIKDADELKGQLLRARTDGGSTSLVVIGPQDFKSEKAVDLGAQDMSQFKEQGFENVSPAEHATMIEGEMGDADVIAIAGSGISAAPSTDQGSSSMSTGAAAGTSMTGSESSTSGTQR